MIEVIREHKQASRELQARLTTVGGRNLYGEPMYRLVWGWSRLTPMAGKWTDRDSEGYPIREVIELRMEPKYFMTLNRWIVERWAPAEFYGSPAYWKLKTTIYEDGIPIEALGGYPSRGDYECCFVIERDDQFVQVTPRILDEVIFRMEYQAEQFSASERAVIAAQKEEAKRLAEEQWALDCVDDSFDAFYSAPNTTQANPPWSRLTEGKP